MRWYLRKVLLWTCNKGWYLTSFPKFILHSCYFRANIYFDKFLTVLIPGMYFSHGKYVQVSNIRKQGCIKTFALYSHALIKWRIYSWNNVHTKEALKNWITFICISMQFLVRIAIGMRKLGKNYPLTYFCSMKRSMWRLSVGPWRMTLHVLLQLTDISLIFNLVRYYRLP